MGTFDRQRATATRLILKYGQPVTWRSRSASGGTEAKPGSTVIFSHPVVIAFLTPKLQGLLKALSTVMQTEVQGGGYIGLMAYVPFEPNLKDTVLRGSEELSIQRDNGIEKLDPNGEGAILYTIRFAR
jgi:hypothetical protein